MQKAQSLHHDVASVLNSHHVDRQDKSCLLTLDRLAIHLLLRRIVAYVGIPTRVMLQHDLCDTKSMCMLLASHVCRTCSFGFDDHNQFARCRVAATVLAQWILPAGSKRIREQ